MSSLVPCVCWVPKGASKEVPDKVALSQEEIQELIKQAQDQMRDLKVAERKKGGAEPRGKGKREDVGEEMAGVTGSLSVEEEYDMTHYSSSESEGEGEKVSGAGMGNSLAGLAYYASNDSDPYITLKKTAPEDEEEEDVNILPTDNVLVVGRAEEEFSSVEVYVFSEADVHTYSHHEFLLTSFPLALEWLDFDPEQPDKKGSYVAVGMMSPCIEVWDLDMIDSLEPIYVLGDPDSHLMTESLKKKKKKTKKSVAAEGGGAGGASRVGGGGHGDAVLTLSWNRVVRSILASGSADRTVRVWDLTGPKCVVSIPHPDKVQCIQWHPYEPQLLVTGAFDRRVRLYDCRTPESAVKVWSVDGEVERVLWNHLIPEQLLVSTDAKSVYCMDKTTGSSLFQIHAHEDAITDLSLSCHVPGLLVTASSDDTVKFWDTQDNKPVFLYSRQMHMRAVLCARFCVDAPYALVVGGSNNGFQVMDVSQLQEVSRRFHGRDLIIPVLPGREVASRGKGEAGRTTHAPRGTQIKGKEKGEEEEEEEEEEVEVEVEVEGGKEVEVEVEESMQLEMMEVEAESEASSQASFSLPKSRREGVRSKKRKDKKFSKEKQRH